MPRHPPCALHILTVISSTKTPKRPVEQVIVLYFCLANCAVFKVRRETDREDIPARSLKTQQRAGGSGYPFRAVPAPDPDPVDV